jgi:hypothetical protein
MPIVQMNDKGEFELVETDLDSWKSTFRRLLINGPPISGKSTSLLTFPPKRHILVAPGELGHSSLREDDDTKVYYWRFDPSATTIQYMKLWISVQKLTNDILSGACGEVNTFAWDGLHKLYYLIMKAFGWTSSTDPRQYVKYHEAFENYIRPVLGSNVPYVVATTYDGQEAVEAGSNITKVYPDLPGKMAKQVMGMFPVVFHSERRGEGDKETFIWQLRTTGKVQGCGLHLPVELSKQFPAEVEQDWNRIEAIVEGVK